MKQCSRVIVFIASIFQGHAAFSRPSAPRLRTSLSKGATGQQPQVSLASHDLVVTPVAADKRTRQNSSLPSFLVEGRTNEKSMSPRSASWKISCDTHIKMHPDEISCQANCPYLRSEPTRLCQ